MAMSTSRSTRSSLESIGHDADRPPERRKCRTVVKADSARVLPLNAALEQPRRSISKRLLGILSITYASVRVLDNHQRSRP